jgi:flagellar assembly protein FliH
MKQLQDLLKDKVSNYEFEPLFSDSIAKEGFETFEFKPIERGQIVDTQEHERTIHHERKLAQEKQFKIAPIVREHRGLNRQEDLEKQRLIQEEVERQLVRIQDQAYKDGFNKGLEEGQEEVFKQTRAEVEQKLESLEGMIQQVLLTQEELLQEEKQTIYRTIKNLTKWVILRELEDDGDYVDRLLEKLISEIQLKSNILIRLDPKSFTEKPDILEMLQSKIGEMKNVRVETDYDIGGPGIIVESDNGIINGTLTEQFKSLSKLFENVGLKVEDTDGEVPFEGMKVEAKPESDIESNVEVDEEPDTGVEGSDNKDEDES